MRALRPWPFDRNATGRSSKLSSLRIRITRSRSLLQIYPLIGRGLGGIQLGVAEQEVRSEKSVFSPPGLVPRGKMR